MGRLVLNWRQDDAITIVVGNQEGTLRAVREVRPNGTYHRIVCECPPEWLITRPKAQFQGRKLCQKG